jgi:hypothetical protein
MGSLINNLVSDIPDDYISVRSAVNYIGHNQHYLHRLLRSGRFRYKKIGQIWFIDRMDFVNYLNKTKVSGDKIYGPHSFQSIMD